MARDTDADWETIARVDPYFGVLADPRFRTANLTDEAVEEFFRSGRHDIAAQLGLLKQRFGDFSPRSALDFGCGVGRLTRALAEVTGDAVGVDVSASMLTEARRGGATEAMFQHELPDRLFDWIVSIIVFQHIPPERGYRLLRDLVDRLAPAGCLTLQFAIYRDPRHAGVAGGRLAVGDTIDPLANEAALAALPKGEMVMFDYDLTVVAAILFSAGIEVLEITHTDHGGFHGANVTGRRTP